MLLLDYTRRTRLHLETQSAPSTEVFDPGTGAWTAVGDAPAPYASATALQSGRVMAAGTPRPGSTSVGIFDPATLSWTTGPPLLESRAAISVLVTLPSGGVLVAGGNRGPSGAQYLNFSELSVAE